MEPAVFYNFLEVVVNSKLNAKGDRKSGWGHGAAEKVCRFVIVWDSW